MAYTDTNWGNTDAVSRRRQAVSSATVNRSWDVPKDYGATRPMASQQPTAQPNNGWGGTAGGYGGAGTYGSGGDVLLDSMRDNAYADAGGRIRGARLAASGAVGADPALSGYASLNAMISGQGDAAHDVNRGALEYLIAEKKRRDTEAMMRLQLQLQEEMQRRMNSGAWLGDLGQLVGTLGGAYLGGPAGAAIGRRVAG